MLLHHLARRSIPRMRIAQMASQMSSAAPSSKGASINDIPKSWSFTSRLPADQLYPTPADSHKTPRDQIGPRQVRDAIFTWVRPQTVEEPELLAISPAAMRDLGIRPGTEQDPDFLATVAGNKLQGWDEEKQEGGYPWAQLYGGFQFGSWAGQLGDGRAISLFETTNPDTKIRYELQLKGAGLTPYSRFADGKAVLRSSIREFVVSEALNGLGIPTTRALSLVLTPHAKVRRERTEPGAIVARFATSWLRLGNFDILRARGDRDMIRKLATYLSEDVLGGWEALPGRLNNPDDPTASGADLETPPRGIPGPTIQGPDDAAENRFVRMYREVARRNAVTVARWQAYGFMNGVLNTDNTSLSGLSIDYGPFAFMDNFDPAYTPNHDDHMLRYSYRNQPTIIWWNLVRLGESLGELLGSGSGCDAEEFVEKGVKEADAPALIARAEKIITQVGEEYKAVFLGEYKRVMGRRLGLRTSKESDFQELFSELLDTLEAMELDFHLFFRRLSAMPLSELPEGEGDEEAYRSKAEIFFYKDGVSGIGGEKEGRKRIGEWLGKWRARVVEDWGVDGGNGGEVAVSAERDGERMAAMKAVNPNFVPRSWILDEVIQKVEKGGERDILRRVMHMALHPFEDTWDGREFDDDGYGGATTKAYQGDAEEEKRWTGDVPRYSRSMQCSCSS